MTVLHIIEPFASGITTFIIHLARELPEHRHIVLHGARTSVDTIEKVRTRFPPHVEFREWKPIGREIEFWRDLRALYFLLGFLRKTRFDVIHLHSSKAGFLGRLACFLLRIKPVVYSPNAGPFLRKDIPSSTRRLFAFLEWMGSRMRGQVVCSCRSEQQAYKIRGVDAMYINNGTRIFDMPKIRNKKTRVICAALIKRQKDPKLFSAIAEAYRDRSDVEFYWVGDGELREEITSPNVHVTGWLDEAEVNTFYCEASVYLATSAWEGLPYAVLEAMNAGTCLLLSNCVGHVDLVEEGKNGYLFNGKEDAIDKLNRLILSPAEIERMGAASREFCRSNFDVRQTAKAYDSLYLKLTR